MSATVIDELAGLTAEELALLRQTAADKRKQAERRKPGTPLKTPIIFWNERYPGEKIHDPSLNAPIRFALGQFTAKTEEQAAVLRRVGNHIYEGVDLQEPMRCDGCHRDFWNRALYMDHMNRHAR